MTEHAPSVDHKSITSLLKKWQDGCDGSEEALLRLVYAELKKISSAFLKREKGHISLQTTELVNEAYIRLMGTREIRWEDRAHYFGIAAKVMRQLISDHLRTKNAQKRGGGEPPLVLEEDLHGVTEDRRHINLQDLDMALRELDEMDPRKCKIVELRYFAGLSIEDTGKVLSISPATVKREWNVAKAWLYRYMTGHSIPGEGNRET
ncbi:Sigma-70 family RNA polymerase sigma factor [Sulfidibacter corallicola]|uniref:Sigma-70 family RNA polymerase sigma factor n=1 Tax=Sulfidibacter corallicola TaxID=2818388 RepID=A0A8A4TRG2_SULCO|nr:sigma-70 family RNA polymerase sigma factor [Sulfidibacter corallicola]QTD51581.1 sigma-70 family RNA polymerase sigma factor [Sulfidibacter corallicola]